MAVWELDSTVKMLGRALKISLEGYRFTTSREHYGMIKNEMARQYNDKGDKLFISDDEGIWLWIDDSHGLAELETNEPTNSRMVQGWITIWRKQNSRLRQHLYWKRLTRLTIWLCKTQRTIVTTQRILKSQRRGSPNIK